MFIELIRIGKRVNEGLRYRFKIFIRQFAVHKLYKAFLALVITRESEQMKEKGIGPIIQ